MKTKTHVRLKAIPPNKGGGVIGLAMDDDKPDNRDAVSMIVAAILTPGRKLLLQALAPGRNVLSQIRRAG